MAAVKSRELASQSNPAWRARTARRYALGVNSGGPRREAESCEGRPFERFEEDASAHLTRPLA